MEQMTPVAPQFRHDPKNGIFGDCHRSCIASILDLPISAVPHFWHDGCDGDEFIKRIQDYLKTLGRVELMFYYVGDPRQFMKKVNPNVYWILGGSSYTGNHSVVCLGDEIVHDPNHGTIQGPLKEGYYCVSVIGVLNG
jgi:hypothetical protein